MEIPAYDAHPKLLVFANSFIIYLLYKRYEPAHPGIHAAMLLGTPTILCIYLGAQLSVPQSIRMVLSHWVLILAFTALYRLSPIHPLSQYPGPTLSKLTKLHAAYHNARGDFYIRIRELHHQYGDVVRIGPNELSFNRQDALQPIYVSKTMKKGPYYDTRILDGLNTRVDGIRDFDLHRTRRGPWTNGLASFNAKEYDKVIVQTSRELVEELAKRHGQSIDLSRWTSLYGFDFTGRLVYGRDFGLLKAGEDRSNLILVIEKCLYMSGIISQLPWILPILGLIPAASKSLLAIQRTAAQFSGERAATSSHMKDLYYYLAEDVSAASSGIRPAELAADCMFALIASSEPTSLTLSHLFYFIMCYPVCADRLRHEIDIAFPKGKEPSTDLARLAELPYLNACINETLRLLPPVPGDLQRKVELGSGGTTIGPYFVPEGTQVLVHFSSLHRNPQEFSPIPETFWPDRWLVQDTYTLPSGDVVGREQVRTNRAAFVPFSVGPQNCPGEEVAHTVVRAAAAALAQRFDVRPAEGYDLARWEAGLVDVYITLHGALPAVLTHRAS